MAIPIPGADANDVGSDQVQRRLIKTGAHYPFDDGAPQEKLLFTSYAATAQEGNDAFRIFAVKIPPLFTVSKIVLEHGDFVDAGSAFNANIGLATGEGADEGTNIDVDAFLVDEDMSSAGVAHYPNATAAGAGLDTEARWVTIQFEAPGAALLAGAQLRLWVWAVSEN